MSIKLNKRLLAVSDMVEENSSFIDIGCDHALLSIYLYQNKKPLKVIASDIKDGPLKHAKENIKKYNLEDKIILKLGNGVNPIEDDIDTIVISGIGGLNMIGILKYDQDKYKNVNTIILSPNSDTYEVRKEICKLGFFIDNEELVKDNNIIYPVIRFKRGRKKYKRKELIYGPILILKHNSLLIEYLENEKLIKEKLLKVLPNKYLIKKIQLKKELKIISSII